MSKNAAAASLLVVLALGLSACGSSDDKASTSSTKTATTAAAGKKPHITVPSAPAPKNLVKKDLKQGSGPVAKQGDTVTVQYVGVNYADGKQFDASWDRGQPFTFQLGAGSVIEGWDKGVVGMRVGGRRELIIPPYLGYGLAGQPPTIQPNETLLFVVDLEKVASGKAAAAN